MQLTRCLSAVAELLVDAAIDLSTTSCGVIFKVWAKVPPKGARIKPW